MDISWCRPALGRSWSSTGNWGLSYSYGRTQVHLLRSPATWALRFTHDYASLLSVVIWEYRRYSSLNHLWTFNFHFKMLMRKYTDVGSETSECILLDTACSIQINLYLLAAIVAICSEGTISRHLSRKEEVLVSIEDDDKYWILFLANSFELRPC